MGAQILPGLKGLAVADTRVSDVDGVRGFYHYRGLDPTELSEHASFEDVWALLVQSEPVPPETVPAELAALLPAVATLGGADQIAPLRTAVSITGQLLGCRSWLDQDPDETRAQAQRLAGLMSSLAAALYRSASGLPLVEPTAELGFAANYLWMIQGTRPDASRARALERYLILAADHAFANSTFALRVVASSGADVAAAITTAIGALSGPLHGGAVSKVPQMLDAIGGIDNVESYVTGVLDRGEIVMGFGHPVYETEDPRTRVLREMVKEIGGERVELALEVERCVVRLLNERKPGRRHEANVDFYAGIVIAEAGVPEDLFLPTFVVARTIGWVAHFLEQTQGNKIFRPKSRYVGKRLESALT